MSEPRGSTGVQLLFGALLGGLMSSFVGAAVYTVVLDSGGPTGPRTALAAVLVGIGSATAFMVAGLLAPERAAWLADALLFASGFTALWTLPLSFGAQQRWVVLTAFGVAIVVGLAAGWRRFGRDGRPATVARDTASALY